MLAACGGSDSSVTNADEPTTTVSTVAEPTSTTTPVTVADADVDCGPELPLFPTVSLAPGTAVVDVEGRTGPAPGAEAGESRQLVRHWVGDDVVLEMRWPAGPGPDVDSTIAVTQLIETGDLPPCDVVRVSAYGPQAPAADWFAAFVDSLEGSDAKESFLQAQSEEQTVATAAGPGRCSEPVYTELDEFGDAEPTQVGLLLTNYVEDRSAGSGYEACFTVAALRQLDDIVAEHGQPDLLRPAGPPDSSEVAVLATYLDRDPLLVLRDRLRVSTVDDGGRHRLVFGAVSTGPDSLVGESEAVAFIDEFLLYLADRNYEEAVGYLINEGAGEEVLEAMPTLLDEGRSVEALRSYCRRAMCAATYKIGGTIEFDANSRQLEVTFSGPRGTIETPMRVSVFENQLSILTPPPLPQD